MRNSLLIYLLFLNVLLSCKSSDKTIEMKQMKTGFPVIVLLSKKHEKIKLIKFPVKLRISNSIWVKKSYSSTEYDYNPYTKGIGESLYTEQDGKLKRIRRTKHKNIYPFQSKEYVMYSSYRLDSSNTVQKQLKPYVDQMLIQNQDTLTIGTVVEFKQKHEDLLMQLTDRDSIYLRILNTERNGYEKGVKIPVKW